MRVQRKTHAWTSTTSAEVALDFTVNKAKAFIVVNTQSTSTSTAAGTFTSVRAEFNSDGSGVVLTRSIAAATETTEIQVIESENISVQHGSITTTGGTTEGTDTISAVDLTKSFIVSAGQSQSNSTVGAGWHKVFLSNTTTVTATREVTTSSTNIIHYQVVTLLESGASVQHKTLVVSGVTDNSAAIDEVDTGKTIVFGTFMSSVTGNYNRQPYFDLTSTTVTATKSVTNGTTTAEVYVVTWPSVKVLTYSISDVGAPTAQTITTVDHMGAAFTVVSSTSSATTRSDQSLVTTLMTTKTNVNVAVGETTATVPARLQVVHMGMYSRGFGEALASDTADLGTLYSTADRSKVATVDAETADIEGSNYLVHLFRKLAAPSTSFTGRWTGQSTLAASTSSVILQVYNYNTPGWETVDTDNTTAANTNITLEATVDTNINNYIDTAGVVSFRVYQDQS
jgi:hypothetical protein